MASLMRLVDGPEPETSSGKEEIEIIQVSSNEEASNIIIDEVFESDNQNEPVMDVEDGRMDAKEEINNSAKEDATAEVIDLDSDSDLENDAEEVEVQDFVSTVNGGHSLETENDTDAEGGSSENPTDDEIDQKAMECEVDESKLKMVILETEAVIELTNKLRNIDLLQSSLTPNQHFLYNSAGVKNDCWQLSDSLQLKKTDQEIGPLAFKLELTLEPGLVDPRVAQLSILIRKEDSPPFHNVFFKSCEIQVDLLQAKVMITNDDNSGGIPDKNNNQHHTVFASKAIKFKENSSFKNQNVFDISTVASDFCRKVKLRELVQGKHLPSGADFDSIFEFEFIPARVRAKLEVCLESKTEKLVFQNYQVYESSPVVFPIQRSPKPTEKLSPMATKALKQFQGLRDKGHDHLLVRFHWTLPVTMELMHFGYASSMGSKANGERHRGQGRGGYDLAMIEELMRVCENILVCLLTCEYNLEMAVDIWECANKCERSNLESKALFTIIRNSKGKELSSQKNGQSDVDELNSGNSDERQLLSKIFSSFLKDQKLTNTSLVNLLPEIPDYLLVFSLPKHQMDAEAPPPPPPPSKADKAMDDSDSFEIIDIEP